MNLLLKDRSKKPPGARLLRLEPGTSPPCSAAGWLPAAAAADDVARAASAASSELEGSKEGVLASSAVV